MNPGDEVWVRATVVHTRSEGEVRVEIIDGRGTTDDKVYVRNEDVQSSEMNALCINCGARRSGHYGADEACTIGAHPGKHFEESSEIIGITVAGGPKGFPRSITYNGIRYTQEPK